MNSTDITTSNQDKLRQCLSEAFSKIDITQNNVASNSKKPDINPETYYHVRSRRIMTKMDFHLPFMDSSTLTEILQAAWRDSPELYSRAPELAELAHRMKSEIAPPRVLPAYVYTL
ncbi:hypothetical protein Dthio_PD0158 [Desulfonatronospira thiodismutans ASO3-1]|uniref:Uncharacterized protein n=1 Tax=Desulfonatronospira thiodismutans ASO3-1 TaxID=555779 RepID=D6SU71_9BACT|nr:hypothetical protein [Desulfonatronospira thiodismutans]EFI32851.1 hypothetical protein Dthio_PD0158 [Desulfonatronospira thiodismutans ASO3-1]